MKEFNTLGCVLADRLDMNSYHGAAKCFMLA